MSKLYHSPLFDDIREYFVQSKSSETIFLFVPFVKTKVLEKLLEGIKNRIVIVTTWEPNNIQFGSSDLTLYPYCKDHDISLYVSQNMHLKVYSVGLSDAILSTGNVSYRGLLPDGNYEAATMLECLTVEDRLYFEKIRREARLVDDTMYDELKKWNEENKIEQQVQIRLDDIISAPVKDNFSVSSLPMTRSVDDLILGYQKITSGNEPSDDSEVAACILHDLTNYNIGSGLDSEDFVQSLTVAFFSHPFTQRIDEFITPEAYFGRIKEWIQNNCTDVPVPSRRELTENVQVLLEWFEHLGNGKYVIDVPGRRSQRISKIK